MHCRQCWDRVGGDWVEMRERHVVRLGDRDDVVVVEAVVLCAPPRVCVQEYSAVALARASETRGRDAGAEPF